MIIQNQSCSFLTALNRYFWLVLKNTKTVQPAIYWQFLYWYLLSNLTFNSELFLILSKSVQIKNYKNERLKSWSKSKIARSTWLILNIQPSIYYSFVIWVKTAPTLGFTKITAVIVTFISKKQATILEQKHLWHTCTYFESSYFTSTLPAFTYSAILEVISPGLVKKVSIHMLN